MTTKPFYTVHEVADILRVSTSRIRNIIRDENLQIFRVGRPIYIPHATLKALLSLRDHRMVSAHQSARDQLLALGFAYSRGKSTGRRGWWKDGTWIAATAQQALDCQLEKGNYF